MFKLRFWKVVITALFKFRATANSRLRFWVTFFDCDIYLHMNNASYLKFMDLGRWDWIIRSGVAKYFLKHALQPVVVNINIDYKKSLNPGQFFYLETHLESVQERTMTLRQDFFVNTDKVASAKLTAVILKRGKVVKLAEALSVLPPEVIKLFNVQPPNLHL